MKQLSSAAIIILLMAALLATGPISDLFPSPPHSPSIDGTLYRVRVEIEVTTMQMCYAVVGLKQSVEDLRQTVTGHREFVESVGKCIANAREPRKKPQ